MKLCRRAILRIRYSTVEVLGNSSQSIYARAMYGPSWEGEGKWGSGVLCVWSDGRLGWYMVVTVRERSSNIDF